MESFFFFLYCVFVVYVKCLCAATKLPSGNE